MICYGYACLHTTQIIPNCQFDPIIIPLHRALCSCFGKSFRLCHAEFNVVSVMIYSAHLEQDMLTLERLYSIKNGHSNLVRFCFTSTSSVYLGFGEFGRSVTPQLFCFDDPTQTNHVAIYWSPGIVTGAVSVSKGISGDDIDAINNRIMSRQWRFPSIDATSNRRPSCFNPLSHQRFAHQSLHISESASRSHT